MPATRASQHGIWRICLSVVVAAFTCAASAETLEQYAERCDLVTGVTVPDFDCDAGELVPTTNHNGTSCDRPQQLREICDPGSRFQVLANTADAYVVAHCRKGNRGPKRYNDIAVIQHSRVSGATCFYQAAADDKKGESLIGKAIAPRKGTGVWAEKDDASHWMTPQEAVNEGCGGCHDNGAIIRSPYLAQVEDPANKTLPPGAEKKWLLPGAKDETFNSDQPYCFLGKDFASWKIYSVDVEGNSCNKCHRMGVSNIGDENGTSRDFGIRATAETQKSKNPHSPDSPIWMPPDADLSDRDGRAQSRADAEAIKACAEQFREAGPLPDSPACRITPLVWTDTCLIGKWEATAVKYDTKWTPAGGGTGFRVEFNCDGTQIIDYTDMKPFGPTSYAGKAVGRLSIKDGSAKVEWRGPGSVKRSFVMPGRPAPIEQNLANQLGPGALGETTGKNDYTCKGDTLTYRGSLNFDRRDNFEITLTRQKE